MPVDLGSILVQGALISALYALIALGFTMIFGVGGVLNLAHGALVMAGAVAYAAVVSGNFVPAISSHPAFGHPVIGIAAALAAVGALSYVMYRGLIQYIEENIVITFLVTVLLAVFAQEVADIFLPESEVSVSLLPAEELFMEAVSGTVALPVAGRVQWASIVMFVASWLVIGALWYYVTRTDGGRAIRATAMSERGARLNGVDIHAVRARTWLIAGVLAGLAGVFVGTQRGVTPDMWLYPLSLAFIIVVIGGIGSIKGSIVAAYLIGFLETGTVEWLGPSFEGIFSLVVLLVVLLVRPEGLFGREFHHE